MKRIVIQMVAIVVMLPALSAAADLNIAEHASTERIAVGTCAGCHGASGVSTLPKFPVLAAQQANYLASQLKAFKSRTRGDPDALAFMWGIAASLDDAQIADLAKYYAAQRAHSGSGSAPDRAAMQRGQAIFENGIDSQEVPACNSCHGATGEGKTEGPRLAGQHTQYFLAQMRSFQLGLRDAASMHEVAIGLKPSNLADLAAYVASR
jgi:cytochrome c553